MNSFDDARCGFKSVYYYHCIFILLLHHTYNLFWPFFLFSHSRFLLLLLCFFVVVHNGTPWPIALFGSSILVESRHRTRRGHRKTEAHGARGNRGRWVSTHRRSCVSSAACFPPKEPVRAVSGIIPKTGGSWRYRRTARQENNRDFVLTTAK